MTDQMGTVSVVSTGDRTVVRLVGEFDESNVADVDAALSGIVAAPGAAVDLDLDGVGFMSSSGLRSLLILRMRVVEAGGRVEATTVSRSMENLLHTAGCAELFRPAS